jgi:hypothetical protein
VSQCRSLFVSQAFCSALPVAYTQVPARHWQAFASLVLEAAHEATMWSAVLNAKRGASNVVLLTLLGGGAFGNDDVWIFGAMRRALETVSSFALEVKIVATAPRRRQSSKSQKSFSEIKNRQRRWTPHSCQPDLTALVGVENCRHASPRQRKSLAFTRIEPTRESGT